MATETPLGLTTKLAIVRIDGEWAYLGAGGSGTEMRLQKTELPPQSQVGDELEAFVYTGSGDVLLATRRRPKLFRDEVAFLTVTAITDIGAFVDWGLPKELLIPFKEQTQDLAVGDRHPVGLYVDNRGRLAGTMRVSEFLGSVGDFTAGEWVEGEAWRRTPEVGIFVIVERRFTGLLPAAEPTTLKRGEAAKFRVSRVLPDDRIELSLKKAGAEGRDDDADAVLLRLSAGDLKVGDRSSPEELRLAFGLGKKAFKRAVGALLRRGEVRVDEGGFVVLARGKGAP